MKRTCILGLALALGATTLFASQEKSTDLSLAQVQADRKAMVEEILSTQKSRMEIKHQYVKEFQEILVPKQVVRWYQIENKLDAVIAAEMAVSIPFDR